MELIYSRSIDKSMLWDGFSIQSCLLHVVTKITGTLEIGERRNIKFLLDGRIYEGIMLKNQPFSRQKYPEHKEMYQVRYAPSSDFSKALRAIYSDVWEYIDKARKLQEAAVANGEKRRHIKMPDNLQRKIAFFTTDMPDVWEVETFDATDNMALADSLRQIDELTYEQNDPTSTIVEKFKRVKLRVLDRSIGDNLKQLYEYRCQVCGQAIGRLYGAQPIVDAHHIEPFTVHQNNNFDNIMILCPNHHRIIHACHGEFHKQSHDIWYPNGLREPLALNLHL